MIEIQSTDNFTEMLRLIYGGSNFGLLQFSMATTAISAIARDLVISGGDSAQGTGPDETVETRLSQFEDYYQAHSCTCPLRPQRDSIAKRGLPPKAPPAIQLLLAAEFVTGNVLGIQDAMSVRGAIRLDSPETSVEFEGMTGKLVAPPEDLIISDEDGVIASLLVGPDKRTAIRPSTVELVMYVFDVPGGSMQFERVLATIEARLSVSTQVSMSTVQIPPL